MNPEIKKMIIQQTALLAHQIALVFDKSVGDFKIASWHDLTVPEKEAMLDLVNCVLEDKGSTIEEAFFCWSHRLRQSGWTAGIFYNQVDKKLPLLRDWFALPHLVQARFEIIVGIVHAVTYSHTPPPPKAYTPAELIAIDDEDTHPSDKYAPTVALNMGHGFVFSIATITGRARRTANYTISQWNNLPQDTINDLVDREISNIRASLTKDQGKA